MGEVLTKQLQIAKRNGSKMEYTFLPFERNRNQRNRMRKIRSSGSVGERRGNEPLYLEVTNGGG